MTHNTHDTTAKDSWWALQTNSMESSCSARRRLQNLAGHFDSGASASLTSSPTSAAVSPSQCPHLPLRALPGPEEEDAVAYDTHNHSYLESLHQKYGPAFRIIREGRQVMFVRDAKAVRRVLLDADDFGKTWDSEKQSRGGMDYVMNLIQPMLSHTIFNTSSQDNARQRKMLRPLLLAPELLLPYWTELADAEVGRLASGVVDAQDMMHTLVKKMILVILCGTAAEQMWEFMPIFDATMEHFTRRYAVVCHDKSTTEADIQAMTDVHHAAIEMVQKFKHLQGGMEGPQCIMQLCLAHEMSEEQLAATAVNVLIAAGEAPASVLAQLCEQLARTRQLQDRLLAELQAAPQTPLNELIEGEGLPLTWATVQEALRLFAPATLVQREARRDTEVEGVAVPKGTIVGVCVSAVHSNEETWSDPDLFNPERPDLDYDLSPGFMTFSKGPRSCPGKHLAVNICQVVLATLVSQFELQLAPPRPVDMLRKVPKMVQWSVEGIPVVLHRRAGQ